jgi:hypothetical protein
MTLYLKCTNCGEVYVETFVDPTQQASLQCEKCGAILSADEIYRLRLEELFKP